ncbi:MAG: hypothetical protein JW891_00735 [Candidatus Lokiarchaeota archaeon]|nr:hypothetical protein [Candidatus Lokiarchaeota archaeon]
MRKKIIATVLSILIIISFTGVVFFYVYLQNSGNDWHEQYKEDPEFLPNPGGIDFGMNLDGINDWGREWPFKNLMKLCRPFLTGNDHWVSGGNNTWNTGLIDQIPCDEDGYPLQLPLNFGMEALQIVHTAFATLYNLPLGNYTFLYDGEGEFEFTGNWEVLAHSQGRYVLNMTTNEDFHGIQIQNSTLGNHARNFRLIKSEYEDNYLDNPFNPAWLDKLSNFDTIRFMDWGCTNFHDNLTFWEDRSKVSEYCYSHERGVPYEIMIELCNLLNKNAWVCVPHEASDDYISQMAQLFRDTLDPELTLYVEYSNEIWNWMFPATHYCYNESSEANLSVPWPERIAPFIQNALDIFSTTFSGQMYRLQRVVGVQAGWFDVGNRTISNIDPDSYDIISPTAYFGFDEDAIAFLEQKGAKTTVEDVFNLALDGIDKNIIPWISMYLNRTIELGKQMAFYEAGQHLTPYPFGSEQPYGQALVDIQSHDCMYYLYNYLFNQIRRLRNESGYQQNFLMEMYSFATSPSARYGTWGVLPDIFLEPPYLPDAPKYQAILDNME